MRLCGNWKRDGLNLNSRIKRLAVNSALFAVNAFATKLISFVLVPLYTSHLTAAEYGLTDMSLTVISLVSPLATLSIVEAAVRLMIADKKNADEYAAISFTVTLLSIVVVCVLSPVLELPIFGGLGEHKGEFVLAYSASAFLSYFGEVARGAGQIRIIPVCATVSSLITLGITWLFMGKTGDPIGVYFAAVSIGPLAASLLYLVFGRFVQRIGRGYAALVRKPGRRTDLLQDMLSYSLPLVPNSLFWWIGTSISRFFITGILGIAASGLYAAASKIPNLLNTVYSIFLQAWQLSAFDEQDEEERARFFGSVFRCLQAVIVSMCSLLSLCAPFLASLLIKGESFASWPLIGIMLLSSFGNILSSFYGTVFTATMNTSCIMSTTIRGSICCIVLTPVLTIPFGLMGACIASTITQFVVFFARVSRAHELVPFDVGLGTLIPSIFFLTVQALAMALFSRTSLLVSLACFTAVLLIQGHSVYRFLIEGGRMRRGQP